MFTPGSVYLSFPQKVPTAPIQARIADPSPAIAKWPEVMRRGEGSVSDQHARQATMARNGRITPWPRTKAFGNVPAPSQGLMRSGAYMAAWKGEGGGAITRIRANAAAIGVSRGAFRQVDVFQSDRPTVIGVTPKMRVYLGVVKGVWLRKTTVSIRVEPRAFRVNPPMIRRARAILVNYVANGTAEEYQPGVGRAA